MTGHIRCYVLPICARVSRMPKHNVNVAPDCDDQSLLILWNGGQLIERCRSFLPTAASCSGRKLPRNFVSMRTPSGRLTSSKNPLMSHR